MQFHSIQRDLISGSTACPFKASKDVLRTICLRRLRKKYRPVVDCRYALLTWHRTGMSPLLSLSFFLSFNGLFSYKVSSRARLLDVGRNSGASKSNSRPRKLLVEVLIEDAEDNDGDNGDDNFREYEDQLVEPSLEGNTSPVPRYVPLVFYLIHIKPFLWAC